MADILHPSLARDPERLLVELNRYLAKLDDHLQYAVTRDRKTGDIDLNKRRIRNVGHTKERSDAPSREELVRKGMYENPQGEHHANSIIVAPHGVRSLIRAEEPHELITLGQAKELLGTTDDAVVTTNVDQYIRGDKLFAAPAFTAFSLNLPPAALYNDQSFSNSAEVLGTFMRITGPTTNFTITGLRRTGVDFGGAPGMILVLWNKTNFTMTLQHDANSSANNRFLCPNNANVAVTKSGSVMVIYSDFDKRWVVLER